MTRLASVSALLLSLAAVPACTSLAPPADSGARMDVGVDAATADDAGALDDAGAPDDTGATSDTGGTDDTGTAADAGADDTGTVADSGANDAGTTTDSGASTACEAAGGSCVPLVPRACPAGIVGDATWYACGGGVGVECCLPPNTPPVCRNSGSRSEGWYAADGTRICGTRCTGATASCGAAGTRSEGWYASDPAAGCTTGNALIDFANCAP